jgi:trimethylguanosine synthase
MIKLFDKVIDFFYIIRGLFDQSPYGKDTQVFWVRRKEIFCRWNEGIQTDEVGLFSATPEKVASEIAQSVKSPSIVDAFCGIGATAIAFAKVCDRVYAIDNNQNRLNMTAHNAKIYGVDRKIKFICDDVISLMQTIQADAIFLDPPWGGVEYLKIKNFRLSDFNPDGNVLLDLAFKNYRQVILRVPRQFDLGELKKFNRKFIAQDNNIRSKLYSKTIYFN